MFFLVKVVALFLFFLFILASILGFSALRMLKRLLFGNGNNNAKKAQKRQQTNESSSTRQQQSHARESYTPTQRKKIFTPDEGEYVDYEDVK